MKRYRLTPEAENDLNEITDYLAADDQAAAHRLIDSIEAKCQALAEAPGISQGRDELAPKLARRKIHDLLPVHRRRH